MYTIKQRVKPLMREEKRKEENSAYFFVNQMDTLDEVSSVCLREKEVLNKSLDDLSEYSSSDEMHICRCLVMRQFTHSYITIDLISYSIYDTRKENTEEDMVLQREGRYERVSSRKEV